MVEVDFFNSQLTGMDMDLPDLGDLSGFMAQARALFPLLFFLLSFFPSFL